MELSNAEEEVESITGTGASDAESESEDITGQSSAVNTPTERSDPFISANESQDTTTDGKNSANIMSTSTKKKKRKRSKKGRH